MTALVASVMGLRAMPGDTVVSLVTFAPGSEIYELEGHTALRITTPGYDTAISYGMFDFDKPGFVYRYVKGETDYSVGDIPWVMFAGAYAADGRRITEQVLDMTPAQKRRLLDMVRVNLEPANREYRYNYVRDNCATRPLAMVERAMGDSVVLGPPPAEVAPLTTWRSHMAHYHANYPWYQFGIDLALGNGIDRPITNRERAFAPVVLEKQLDGATVGGKPLVAHKRVLYDVPADAAVADPTPWLLRPVTVCWLLFALCLGVCVRRLRRHGTVRALTATVLTVYGLMGLLIAFLVLVSEHEATCPNYNILWLNPLCLVGAVLCARAKWSRLAVWYQIANFVCLLALCAVWIAGEQSPNAAFIPLVLLDMMLAVVYIVTERKRVKIITISE